MRPLVEDQPVARYREVLQNIHRLSTRAEGDDGEGSLIVRRIVEARR